VSFCAAETIVDKAIILDSIGGVYGNQKPTEFLSLTLKMLTLQPEKAILLEYLKAEEFKLVLKETSTGETAHGLIDHLIRYLRALAAFYIRLTFKSFDVYEVLEPLMRDYRKLRTRDVGQFACISPLLSQLHQRNAYSANRRLPLDVL
jgi:pre-mRNA-splicing factor 38A